MSQLQHLPADADAEMIVAAVKKDGAVILDDVISPEFVAALREETDPYMDRKIVSRAIKLPVRAASW